MVDNKTLLKTLRAIKQLGKTDRLSAGMKSLVATFKLPSAGAIRKLAFDPRILTGAVSLSAVAFRNIITKARNLRMSPLAIVAVVTYLETRRDGCNDIPAPCEPLLDDVSSKIPALYRAAFTELLVGERDFLIGTWENGALFHLGMIAVKHLEYELSGDPEQKIIGLEVNKKIQLYTKDGSANRIKKFKDYIRRMDIVLAGEDGSDKATEDDVLVEVKSLKHSPDYKTRFTPWNISKGKNSYHRQFYFDRVLSTENGLNGWDDNDLKASDYQWWFQSFTRKTKIVRSFNVSEMNVIRGELRKLPTGDNQGTAHLSLGFTRKGQNETNYPIADVTSRVKLMNLKNWLMTEAKEHLLNGVDQELIDDLIGNSSEF